MDSVSTSALSFLHSMLARSTRYDDQQASVSRVHVEVAIQHSSTLKSIYIAMLRIQNRHQ
eukprot:scaffold7054_cov218-Alexandrium_tamarense.AAC.3